MNCKPTYAVSSKNRSPMPKVRGKLLYEILNNDNIKEALSEGKLQEAQELAMKLVEKREK